jgi:hypothetical protein
MFLVSRADNLTAICEPTVWTMSDPQHLITLSASTACYGDSFTFFFYFYVPKMSEYIRHWMDGKSKIDLIYETSVKICP